MAARCRTPPLIPARKGAQCRSWTSRDQPATATAEAALSVDPQPHQALRHVHRARQCRSRHRARASSSRSSAPRAAARPRLLRADLRPRRADHRHDPSGRPRHLQSAGRAARLRHRLPVLRAVSQPHDRATTSPTACVSAASARQRDRRARRRAARAGRPRRPGRRNIPRSFPAASSSAWRWRARLALSPGLLLLDEPLSALDARVRARLRGEIRDLQQRLGITTIMVTHDQEEALTMSDRIVVMSKGRIEQVGTPERSMAGRPRPSSPISSAG